MQPPVQEHEEGEDGGEEGLPGEGDVVIDLRRFPRTPQPWDSLGSEFDVEEETVIESRAKVNVLIVRIFEFFLSWKFWPSFLENI